MTIFNRLLALFVMMCSLSATAHDACEPLLGGPTEPNDVQRRLALSLELKKISPPDQSRLHDGNPMPRLIELSSDNSDRLLERAMKGRHRLRRLPADTHKRIEALTAEIDFLAVTTRTSQYSDQYYEQLLGSRHSIPFRLVAIKRGRSPEELAQALDMELISLKTSLLQQYGLVLPYFSTTYRLLKFFTAWDREKFNDLIRSNRFNLPVSVTDQESLRKYLTPDRLFETFPDDKIRDRLSPLRESLHNYVMTFADAEKAWRLALASFLLHAIRDGHMTLEQVEERWAETNGPNRLFSKAQEWLGYEGVLVRVPLAVTPKDYYILRPYQQKVIGRTPYAATIDHDSKPD